MFIQIPNIHASMDYKYPCESIHTQISNRFIFFPTNKYVGAAEWIFVNLVTSLSPSAELCAPKELVSNLKQNLP